MTPNTPALETDSWKDLATGDVQTMGLGPMASLYAAVRRYYF